MADSNIPSGKWSPTVSYGVVTIRITVPHPFDTELPGAFEGTGWVVDKTNGYILTNRHLVGEGPVTVSAIFRCGLSQNIVQAEYIEPLHDFAFVKYCVGSLRFEVEEIPIRPDLARVNLDIRVVGNDAGEVMSFHQGVIVTNYLQASSDTVGGSSGSPVVDEYGRAVGMVAGSTVQASMGFYLDLTLPLRVLKSLQSGERITRGTIQSTWLLRDPATCAARGISREIIDKSGNTGLLIAHRIIPKGPSDGQIQEGDVLLDVEGEKMGSLVQFEDLLDRRVGKKITIRRLRHGHEGQAVVLVQDLFGITPFRLLQFAGAVFHDVRLQVALTWNLPINGVYLRLSVGCFQGIQGVIHSVDRQPTPDFVTFMGVIRKIYHGKKFMVSYKPVSDSQMSHKIVTMSHPWLNTDTKLWTRDSDYSWTDSDPWITQAARAPSPEVMRANQSDESFDAQEKNIASLVRVKTYNHLRTSADPWNEREFDGLVINRSTGFVLISKADCLWITCDIKVIVEYEEIPAKIVYDHTLGNFWVIKFDSTHIECKLRNATFGQGVLKQNDSTTIYGRRQRKVETTVRRIKPMFGSPHPLQTPMNIEVIHLNACKPPSFGVLVDDNGDAVALWLPIWSNENMESVGVSLHLLMPVIESLQHGNLPAECRMLAATFDTIDKVAAHTFGVPQERIPQFPEGGFIQVHHVALTSKPGFLAGDIILYVNGKPAKRLLDLAPAVYETSLLVTVIRGTEQRTLNVPTFPASTWHCKSPVWCLGATIDTPLFSTALTARSLYSELFVHNIARGSPADESQVPTDHFITHVNGKATGDIESFVREIEKFEVHQWCQLTLVSLDGASTSRSVLPNKFFKSKIAQRNDSMPYEWQIREI